MFGSTLLLLVIACGDATPEAPPPAPPPPPPPAAAAPPAKVGSPIPAPPQPDDMPTLFPGGAKVFFVEPQDGATVKSPFQVKMGNERINVAPAGDVVLGTGHHHIIIGPAGIDRGEIVPKDETHIHYGEGQTEAELSLDPGTYKLTLQFADGAHASYGPKLASTIEITVE